jgi:predicted Kef-type K+ transport protein
MTFSSVFHELAAILMLAGVIGVVALKLLSDTREIDSLHGRIAVGFLVVQDIAVILAMILLTSFNLKGGAASPPRRSGCCWWAAPLYWAPPPRCAG